MPGNKSSSFDENGIAGLAKNKPVVYSIEDKNGNPLYIGVAKRGRVGERLTEHLPGGPDPIHGGAKVKIQQKPSIAHAQKAEAKAIKQQQPPKNKKGK